MLWWKLQQLKSSDPEKRIKAIRALGSERNREAVPRLVKTLQDGHPDVRLAAIESLGAIAHPASAEPLVHALEDLPKNEIAAAAPHGEAIAKALASLGEPAVQPAIRALGSEDREIRRWAAHALGMIRDPQAVGPLIGKLEDSRSEVRKSAALALGEIADRGAVLPLSKAALSRDLETRRAAVEALGLLGSEEGLGSVAKALEDSSEPVQLAAVGSLAKIGGLSAAAHLRSAMSATRKTVCDAAEKALQSMSFPASSAEERAEFAVIRGDFESAVREGPAATHAFIQALGFKDPQMRMKAAQALASMRSPDSIQPLLLALKDHYAPVQESAAQALADIGIEARAGLEEALSHYDASVVRLAAGALGAIAAPDSVRPLAEFLIANAVVPGEYPDLFDSVCCSADALGRILSMHGENVSTENLGMVTSLPETIHLRGASPMSLDCSGLRTQADSILRRVKQ